jgi:hypothetical protein
MREEIRSQQGLAGRTPFAFLKGSSNRFVACFGSLKLTKRLGPGPTLVFNPTLEMKSCDAESARVFRVSQTRSIRELKFDPGLRAKADLKIHSKLRRIVLGTS